MKSEQGQARDGDLAAAQKIRPAEHVEAPVAPTPRTDAAHGVGRFANCVDVDFARELERECTELIEALRECEDYITIGLDADAERVELHPDGTRTGMTFDPGDHPLKKVRALLAKHKVSV